MLRNINVEPPTPPASSQDGTLQTLLHIMHLRGYEDETHIVQVASMAAGLAARVGVPTNQLKAIQVGAQLHDLGKIALPDHIVFKPGKLNDEEWAVLKTHPKQGYDLLAPMPAFKDAAEIPYCHHEHWDGSGYPRRLRGQEIPLSARIFTIVDVWDSLAADRPHRAAWKEADIRFFMNEQSGILFDPDLLALFLSSLGSLTGKP